MNIRRTAAILPLAAALFVGGSAGAASADTATSEERSTNSGGVGTQRVWEYTGNDFFWQSDCIAKGEQMMATGHIWAFKCDGSESPVDDYSLFVDWKK